jgi:ATP-dependent DNA ligase
MLYSEPLSIRRQSLHNVLADLGDPIRESADLNATLPTLVESVKAHGLEGLVANAWTAATNPGSAPEPGRRCG